MDHSLWFTQIFTLGAGLGEAFLGLDSPWGILHHFVVFPAGVLRLEQAQKEAVILACTMTNEAQATLFEIDVNSNFALTPVKDPMFPKTPIFLKTVSYCEDEAEAWRRQIKVGITCA